MIHYTLINPFTGFSKTVPKTELLQNLMLNCILLQGNNHIGIVTYRDLVVFARRCADVIKNRMIELPEPDSLYAIQLADQWLEDPNSLSCEQLDFIAGHVIPNDETSIWSPDWVIASPVRVIANANWALEIIAELAWSLDYHAIIAYETQAQTFVENLQSGK